MTTLSEIERQAYLKKIRTWHEQRGMDIEHQILTEPVMRYIERLEDDRQRLLVSVTQLLVIANDDKGYERGIIDKARHLVKTMAQPEREEAHGQDK